MTSPVLERDVEDAFCAAMVAAGWTAPVDELYPLGRENLRDVFLRGELRAALVRINPEVPADGVSEALRVLCRDRSSMDLASANQEFHDLVRDGVKVQCADEDGNPHRYTVRVIDWNTPECNTFRVVRQVQVASATGTLTPDVVGFLNGIPLILVELKGVTVPVSEAVEKNLTRYRQEIPQVMVPNGVLVASNHHELRVGTVTFGSAEHFVRWRPELEGALPETPSERVRSLLSPGYLLDLLENFVLFEQSKSGRRKLLGQRHQVEGVNAALARIAHYGEQLAKKPAEDALKDARRLGVFWHTQGSGKSYSMAFLVRKVMRKVPGDWSFVVVTDREDLDDQIHKNFVATGVATGKHIRASSAKALKKLLASNERVVFTLIQKFRLEDGQKAHPVVSASPYTVVLADEAHRSQYAEFATHLRRALPHAGFMAFTGTPLIAGDETTVERFGRYVSQYTFFQAIRDGATVPLFYEATVPELQLSRTDLDAALEEAASRAGLTAEQQEQAEEKLSAFYVMLNRSSRLDAVARNLLDHFLGLAPTRKAMVVCIDRPTTLRLLQRFEAVLSRRRSELLAAIEALQPWEDSTRKTLAEAQRELSLLETAVVLSRTQGDVDELSKRLRYRDDGVIAYAKKSERLQKLLTEPAEGAYTGDGDVTDTTDADHRAWVEKVLPKDVSALAERFKNPADPLRVVFVCSMWITGFDAPSCGVVYLDKPMANHALMQTIARANRVFPGKDFGLVVDYVGVLKDLERAFSAYERELSGASIDRPVADKSLVLTELERLVLEVSRQCSDAGISLSDLVQTDRATRLDALTAAVDVLAAAPSERRLFSQRVGRVDRVYRSVGEDPRRDRFTDDWRAMCTLRRALGAAVDDPTALSRILETLDAVLDEALDADETRPVVAVDRFDLSAVDLVALARIKDAPQAATKAAALGTFLQAAARAEAGANPTLLGLQKRVEDALASYAQGARDVGSLVDALRREAETLKAHQARAISEGLTRAELDDHDTALAVLGGNASPAVRSGLKDALRALTKTLPEAMGQDWRDTDRGRAEVLVAVRDALRKHIGAAVAPDALAALLKALFDRVYERGG